MEDEFNLEILKFFLKSGKLTATKEHSGTRGRQTTGTEQELSNSAVLSELQGRAEISVQAMGCMHCRAVVSCRGVLLAGQTSCMHCSSSKSVSHSHSTFAQCNELRAQNLKPKRWSFPFKNYPFFNFTLAHLFPLSPG